MDEKSNWPPEILEALEAIRHGEPASDDPALAPAFEALKKSPELAHRAEQIRQWDSHLEEALGKVEVPPGLAQRLLDRLEQAEPPPSPAAATPPTTTRRRTPWRAAATILGLAAAVVLVAVYLSPPPLVSADTLKNLAQEQFIASLDAANEPGELVINIARPTNFPFPRDLLDLPGTTCRRLTDFGGHQAVAYDLPAIAGRRATVYVVRCQANGLPPAAPALAGKGTRSLVLAAWQVDDLVYIAVVDGGQPAYRRLLVSSFLTTA